MKKSLILAVLMTLLSLGANAQVLRALNILDHVGVNASVGSTGLAFEVATPVTDFVQLRAGMSIVPNFKFNTDIDGTITVPSVGKQDITVDTEGSLKRTQGQVILNVYPFGRLSSFFIAGGGYFSGQQMLGLTGHSKEAAQLQSAGIINLGEYELPIDKNGNISGCVKASNSFRPYVGLGWGRPVPNTRVNFIFELGVQFNGKCKVYADDNGKLKELTKTVTNDDDWKKAMDVLRIYPVIKFGISGRIF